MDYKKIFGLAQEKGYSVFSPTHIFSPVNLLHKEKFILLEVALVQKWIMEEHKRHLHIIPIEGKWHWDVYDISSDEHKLESYPRIKKNILMKRLK